MRTKTAQNILLMRKRNQISHVLKIQNNRICTTELTWHPEGRRKVRRQKTTQWRTTGQERSQLCGIAGHQRGQQKTGTGGGSLSGPYVPAGTQRLGEVTDVRYPLNNKNCQIKIVNCKLFLKKIILQLFLLVDPLNLIWDQKYFFKCFKIRGFDYCILRKKQS